MRINRMGYEKKKNVYEIDLYIYVSGLIVEF